MLGAEFAPSRGRGSKRFEPAVPRWSSRRPLTGARIETVEWHLSSRSPRFAPSRGRGSKHISARRRRHLTRVRPLTGARIETHISLQASQESGSPPHGGADRNVHGPREPLIACSPPHGGADRNTACRHRGSSRSPPHGGADRNLIEWRRRGRVRPLTGARIETRPSPAPSHCRGSPLTGAQIETLCCEASCEQSRFAPSRGRGSKLRRARRRVFRVGSSPPHGGAD